MGYIPFTEEEKQLANSVDLVSFLQMRGKKLERTGREHKLIYHDGSGKHDSITIRGSTWFDHKNQVGGGAIKFMREFYGMDFQQAMKELLGGNCSPTLRSPIVYENFVHEPKKEFKLPHRLYLDGLSLKGICDELESRGILTSQKKDNWTYGVVKNILINEKYVGDAILQKTFITDCITKKVKKNNGERAKYLVSNHHKPIIDREVFNQVQEEMARRSSKRKVSDKTTTENGKYSSKYALSELLICGDCGTPYRRTTWAKKGKKKTVWRCINRLENGTRYCSKSPTLEENKLQNAILDALNQYFNCKDETMGILKNNIENVLECGSLQNVLAMESRLKELNLVISDLLKLSVKAGGESNFEMEFQKISSEISNLKIQIETEKSKQKSSKDNSTRVNEIMGILNSHNGTLTQFDDVVIRKVVEYVKVISSDKIQIVFKGGVEIVGEVG